MSLSMSCMEGIQNDLNTSLRMSDCHCCVQFSWLMQYYLLSQTSYSLWGISLRWGCILFFHFTPTSKSFITLCFHPIHHFKLVVKLTIQQLQIIPSINLHISIYQYILPIYHILLLYFHAIKNIILGTVRQKQLTKHLFMKHLKSHI